MVMKVHLMMFCARLVDWLRETWRGIVVTNDGKKESLKRQGLRSLLQSPKNHMQKSQRNCLLKNYQKDDLPIKK